MKRCKDKQSGRIEKETRNVCLCKRERNREKPRK